MVNIVLFNEKRESSFISLSRKLHGYLSGLPRWLNGKESACHCKRHWRSRFDPWVRNIPWRRKWQPTPVFLPGKSHRGAWQVIVHGVTKSWTRLSEHTYTQPLQSPGEPPPHHREHISALPVSCVSWHLACAFAVKSSVLH